MVIEIRALAKPEIYLIGNEVPGRGILGEIFSSIVDHSKSTTTTISSPKTLNKTKVPTFQESVRIIITGQISFKPSYFRRNGRFTSTEFEGRVDYNSTNVNFNAETYYTLNGKDPVRSSNYLYNYLDKDDLEDKTETISPTNTDPSISGAISNNLNSLGFVLKNNKTGDSLITLKARTFYRGNSSPISVAYFRIYNAPSDNLIIDNTDNND